jgi:ribose 5-phosphate isomerase B
VRIAFGSDDVADLGLPALLAEQGHEVVVPVALGDQWPDVGRAVGTCVATGAADLGIVCCWTGTGVSIAANKVPGVRAALCVDAETATGARRWNDANVLAISLRLTTPALAVELVSAFLAGEADEDERANFSRLA